MSVVDEHDADEMLDAEDPIAGDAVADDAGVDEPADEDQDQAEDEQDLLQV